MKNSQTIVKILYFSFFYSGKILPSSRPRPHIQSKNAIQNPVQFLRIHRSHRVRMQIPKVQSKQASNSGALHP